MNELPQLPNGFFPFRKKIEGYRTEVKRAVNYFGQTLARETCMMKFAERRRITTIGSRF